MDHNTARDRSPCRLVIYAVVAAIGLAGCDRKGAGEPHFLGHLVALSGPDRERGADAQRGVRLAVEQLNADPEKWIGGRKVAVLHADTKGEPALFGSQGVRLVAVNHVEALIGGLTREETDQLAPVARDYPVVVVGASGSAGAPPPESAFAVGLTALERAKAISGFVKDRLKPRRATMIVDTRLPIALAVSDAIPAAGLKPEVVTYPDDKPADDKARERLIARIPPETTAVIFAGPLREARALLQSWTGTGRRPPEAFVFAGDDPEAASLATVYPGTQVAWAAAYDPSATADAMRNFRQEFTKKFGTPPGPDAAASYDAARLLFAAARDVKGFDKAKLSKRLAEIKDVAGLMGPLSVGADQVAHGPAVMLPAAK